MAGWLRRLCLGSAHELPTWVRVGVEQPADHVRITLEGVGEPRDVTHNTVMVELVPFVLALGLERRLEPELRQGRPMLRLWDRQGDELGRVGLRLERIVDTPRRPLFLFRTPWSRNRCLPRHRVALYQLYERWVLLNDRNPRNTDKMPPGDLFCCWLLYAYPRPVSLLSFRHGESGNMMPVDLAGPTESPYYLIGLKGKKPAFPLLEEARDCALSTIPYEYSQLVYGMGRNHGRATIDWQEVPFSLASSPTFGIPVPEEAVTVRELSLEATHEIAGHTMIVAEEKAVVTWSGRRQMCHVPRMIQHALLRQGRGFPDFKRDATFDEVVAAAHGGER